MKGKMRLTLHRETLRGLTRDTLIEVAGGNGTFLQTACRTICGTCGTCATCGVPCSHLCTGGCTD